MFALYINIDHGKLLKKDQDFKENDLILSIHRVVAEAKGVVSNKSDYLSFHPYKYEHSRKWLLNCLWKLNNLLKSSRSLVGYSIIINSVKNDYDTIIEDFLNYNFRVKYANSIWFVNNCSDSFIPVVEKCSVISLLDINFINKEMQIEISSDVNWIQEDVNSYVLLDNISYQLTQKVENWAYNNDFKIILYLNFENSVIWHIKFLNYLSELLFIYNPLKALSDEDKNLWGEYFNLFLFFIDKDSSFYVIDNPLYHYNKLVNLWLGGLSRDINIFFVFYNSEKFEVDKYIHSEGKKVFVIDNDTQKTSIITTLELFEVKILYIVLLSMDFITQGDLVKILSKMNYQDVDVQDVMEYLRIKDLIWGQNVLFSNKKNKISIETFFKDDSQKWKEELIRVTCLMEPTLQILKLVISLNNHKQSIPDVFFMHYVNLKIQMGLEIDYHLITNKAISEYGRRKSSRVILGEITDKGGNESWDLSLLDILDNWSMGVLDKVIEDSKALYISSQQEKDLPREAESKIVFCLCLLSRGRIDEAIDYLEINLNLCLLINQKYSYIKSLCFLMAFHFNKGNLTGVLRLFLNIQKYPWFKLKTSWYIYALYIKSRTLAELSDYTEAILCLDEAIELANGFNYMDIRRVLLNWKGLIYAYSGNNERGIDIILSFLPNSESFYFLSQIEFFRGNTDKSIEYINSSHFGRDKVTLFDEKIIWRDGYFVLEEYYNRNRESSILKYEINNFRNFLLSISNPDSLRALEDTGNRISNDSIRTCDYKLWFYLYKSSKNNDLDRDKILQKSVRVMQQRGNNIDTHNKKTYYYKNYWNSLILSNLENKFD